MNELQHLEHELLPCGFISILYFEKKEWFVN